MFCARSTVNHTWAQCSLNPDSHQYDPDRAASVSRRFGQSLTPPSAETQRAQTPGAGGVGYLMTLHDPEASASRNSWELEQDRQFYDAYRANCAATTRVSGDAL